MIAAFGIGDLPPIEANMAIPPLYIVVRLWIRRGFEAEFEAYERKVSRVMSRYGGGIERAIRVSGASSDEPDAPFEVHVLKFPSRDLYDAYLDDAERRSLSAERTGIITNSDALVGSPGPAYDHPA
jgi:antibiotic biosynthesis monooxygenase (ABM) superfamily enzyme